jgi:hypothetical protein
VTKRLPSNTTPIVEYNGQTLHVVRDKSRRRWVLCPLCETLCRHLYSDGQQLACRRCLRLEHAIRHQFRRIPAIHRIRRLRRKIGVDPNPFAIKRNPKVRHRVQAIYAEEAKLLVHMRSFNNNLIAPCAAACYAGGQQRGANNYRMVVARLRGGVELGS